MGLKIPFSVRRVWVQVPPRAPYNALSYEAVTTSFFLYARVHDPRERADPIPDVIGGRGAFLYSRTKLPRLRPLRRVQNGACLLASGWSDSDSASACRCSSRVRAKPIAWCRRFRKRYSLISRSRLGSFDRSSSSRTFGSSPDSELMASVQPWPCRIGLEIAEGTAGRSPVVLHRLVRPLFPWKHAVISRSDRPTLWQRQCVGRFLQTRSTIGHLWERATFPACPLSIGVAPARGQS